MAKPNRSDTAVEADARLDEIASGFRNSFQTVEEMTTHFVREAILLGVFSPGQRLHQDHIAELLGVSRMPVRSSLRKLEAEGLVEFHAHRGAAVRLMTPEEIAEVYELRILLESHLLAQAAKNLTPDALGDLESLASRLRHEHEPTQWLERRQEFYGRLYGLAERARTTALVFELRAEVGPYLVMRKAPEDPDHASVLEYLRSGDVRGASRALKTHLTAVSKELQAMVAEQRGETD